MCSWIETVLDKFLYFKVSRIAEHVMCGKMIINYILINIKSSDVF